MLGKLGKLCRIRYIWEGRQGWVSVLGVILWAGLSWWLVERYGVSGLREWIRSQGIWGYVWYMLVVLLSSVFTPLSLTVVIVMGGAVFGSWVAWVITVPGYVVGCVIDYGLARYVRGSWVWEWMVGKRRLARLNQMLEGWSHRYGPWLLLGMIMLYSAETGAYISGFIKLRWKYYLPMQVVACAVTPAVYLGLMEWILN